MSYYMKCFAVIVLATLTLTACKPGVYYPFGNTNDPSAQKKVRPFGRMIVEDTSSQQVAEKTK